MSKNTFRRAKMVKLMSETIPAFSETSQKDESKTNENQHLSRPNEKERKLVVYEDNPEKELVRKETMQEVREAIKKLKTRQRQVADKYYFKQMNTKDIASSMMITEQRVRQLLTEARKSLYGDLSFMKGDESIFS